MQSRLLDDDRYRWFSVAGLAIVGFASVFLGLEQRWTDAAVLAGLVLLGVIFIVVRDGLPSIFTALFLIAGLANAGGYVFTLWHEQTSFDEVVHAFTSFAVSAAVGWYLIGQRDPSDYSFRRVLAIAAIGIFLGVLWEGFEWLIGIIGSTRDTLIDLAMDSIGAFAAGLFCAWAAYRNGQTVRRGGHAGG